MEARFGQTASLLNDGRTLLVGGQDGNGPKSTLELFDPVANTFKAPAPSPLPTTLASPRYGHAALVYPSSGFVVIVGGTDGNVSLDSTEIFYPLSGTTFAGPPLTTGRAGLSATLLAWTVACRAMGPEDRCGVAKGDDVLHAAHVGIADRQPHPH